MLLSHSEFVPDHDAEFFASIPAKPAVFLLRGEAGTEPYVSKTATLDEAAARLDKLAIDNWADGVSKTDGQ